jgi:hypothetical protein
MTIPLSSATLPRGATLEGLCALPGSLASPVTRVVDGHMLVEKFAPVQLAPVDLVQELTRRMTGMVLTMSGKHMVVDAFDTCGWSCWDPGRDPWRALCHHEDEASGRRTLRMRDSLCCVP